jgi:hypothetical protein
VNSVDIFDVGIEQVQVCTRRNLGLQGEEYQRNIITKLLNTL